MPKVEQDRGFGFSLKEELEWVFHLSGASDDCGDDHFSDGDDGDDFEDLPADCGYYFDVHDYGWCLF